MSDEMQYKTTLDNGAAQLVAARPGVVHSFTYTRSSERNLRRAQYVVRTHCHYAFALERMSGIICSPVRGCSLGYEDDRNLLQ